MKIELSYYLANIESLLKRDETSDRVNLVNMDNNIDLKEEDISIKKIWNKQRTNNRNNKIQNNNSYQNRRARRSSWLFS